MIRSSNEEMEDLVKGNIDPEINDYYELTKSLSEQCLFLEFQIIEKFLS